MSNTTPPIPPTDDGYLSEYSDEEIDLTENPLYQVLSTLLEDAEGNNLCECVNNLNDTLKKQTQVLELLLNKLG